MTIFSRKKKLLEEIDILGKTLIVYADLLDIATKTIAMQQAKISELKQKYEVVTDEQNPLA